MSVLCNEISVKWKAELCGWDNVMCPPLLLLCWRDWEWQLRGGRAGIVLPLPSCAGMAGSRCCSPLSAGSHAGVVLGIGGCCQVAVVGRDSYGFVFPPRVTASAAPFAPSTDDPLPQPNGPHPGSNPCYSQSWKCMCVFTRAPAVFAGPGQSDWLAQMWQA